MAAWESVTPGVCGAVLARSEFIDRCLEKAIEDGIDQLVILGAGFDTRTLRLEALNHLSGIFELDYPATQKVKIDTLRRHPHGLPGHVTYIGIDFEMERLDVVLLKSGYRSDARSLFIWEGVTYYIPAPAVDRTLAFIASHSGHGSALVFDYFSPAVASGACTCREAVGLRESLKRFGEAITSGIDPQTVTAFLAARGFDLIINQPATQYRDVYFSRATRQRPVSEIFYFVHAAVSFPADPSTNHG